MPDAEPVVTENLAVMPLDDPGRALLKRFLSKDLDVSQMIPHDTPRQQLWEMIQVCASGIVLFESRLRRLVPILGYILLLFKNKPSLYKDMGYETFEQFRNQGVGGLFGMHRTSLYWSQIVAQKWPQLVKNPELYAKIGPVKLNIVSKFADGSAVNADHILDMAGKMTVTELRQYTEQRGLTVAGETIGAMISIPCNLKQKLEWTKWVARGEVQSVVGSKDPAEILMAMMKESEATWIAEVHDKEREEKQHALAGRTAV